MSALLLTACQQKADVSLLPAENSEQQIDYASAADLVIEHVNTIDVVSGLQKDMTVVVQDGEIIEIGASNAIDRPTANLYLDGRDKFLIPGLWDAHIHLTFTPELTDSMFRLLIANGITSVRDTGGMLDQVLEQKNKAKDLQGQGLAPSVYVAGPLIDGTPGIYIGELPGYPEIAVTVTSPEEVVQQVDRLVAQGVDLLKAYEMLSPEAFRALIDRAREHGLPVTGHVPLSMTVAEAAEAGLRSMEHTRNIEMACSSEQQSLFDERQKMLADGQNRPGSELRTHIHGAQHYRSVQSFDPERCAAVIQTLVDKDTWQVPTMALMQAFKTPFIVEESWISTFDTLPEPTRSSWKKSVNGFKASLQNPSESMQQLSEVMGWKNSLVSQMAEAGVRFMAGTDAPIFYFTPGFSLHKELEYLVAAGMSPMQVLDAATLAPAEYLGLQDQLGTIEKGMRADLLLLDANPLEDISNTQAIQAVVKNGVLLDRDRLDKLLSPELQGEG